MTHLATFFNGQQRWLFRVSPLPGESLSSVIERCAESNAVGVQRLLRRLGLPDRGVDFDRLNEAGIALHEDALGYRAGALTGTTFAHQIGQTLTHTNPGNRAEWCVSRTVPGKRTDAVCPECLAGDGEIYRRLHWRAGYVSRCERHDRALIDRCPRCESPLATLAQLRDASGSGWLGAARTPAEVVWSCATCEHAWRPVESGDGLPAPVQGRAQPTWQLYQEAILSAHHPGLGPQPNPYEDPPWARLGCSFTYQFLAGVRALITLMHSPQAGRHLRNMLAERVGCTPWDLYAGGVKAQPFESYPADSRRYSLDAIAVLLAGGIEGMIDLLDQARMTSSSLFVTDRYVPHWVQAPMLRHLNGARYSLSASEIAAARAYAERELLAMPEGEYLILDTASHAAANKPRSATASASLSKVALARLLGSRDSKELDKALGRVRRRYTREEAMAFFNRAIQAIPHVPVSRTQRQVVIRTILILMGVAVRGQPVEEVCAWSRDAVQSMLSDTPRTLKKSLSAALQASEHGLAASVLSSRFGARLQGASTRLCAARLMAEHGTPGTWNCANALAGTLAPAGTTNSGKGMATVSMKAGQA